MNDDPSMYSDRSRKPWRQACTAQLVRPVHPCVAFASCCKPATVTFVPSQSCSGGSIGLPSKISCLLATSLAAPTPRRRVTAGASRDEVWRGSHLVRSDFQTREASSALSTKTSDIYCSERVDGPM